MISGRCLDRSLAEWRLEIEGHGGYVGRCVHHAIALRAPCCLLARRRCCLKSGFTPDPPCASPDVPSLHRRRRWLFPGERSFVSERTSFVIAEPGHHCTGVRVALELGVPVLSPQWILDSVAAGGLQDFSQYSSSTSQADITAIIVIDNIEDKEKNVEKTADQGGQAVTVAVSSSGQVQTHATPAGASAAPMATAPSNQLGAYRAPPVAASSAASYPGASAAPSVVPAAYPGISAAAAPVATANSRQLNAYAAPAAASSAAVVAAPVPLSSQLGVPAGVSAVSFAPASPIASVAAPV